MAIDALQHYVQLANGLTKTTREKALAAAKAVLSQVGLDDVATDASERVSKLADDIVTASRANRQLLSDFVAHEVDQAVHRLGLVRLEDLEELRAEVTRLRNVVDPTGATAKKSAAKKAAARAQGAKKASTRATGTRKSTTASAAARKTSATEPATAEAAAAEPAAAEPASPADASPLPEETA